MRIVTLALALALLPLPAHVKIKVDAAVNATVDSDPLVSRAPDHPPEAAQLLAFVELQVSAAVPPLATLDGLAVSVTVGAGRMVTCTVLLALPPAPVHVRRKFLAAVNAPVL